MIAPPEIWLRPWAGLVLERRVAPFSHLPDSIGQASEAARWEARLSPFDAPLLVTDEGALVPKHEDHRGDVYRQGTVGIGDSRRQLFAVSRPRSPRKGAGVRVGDYDLRMNWPDAPDRPPSNWEPQSEEELKQDRAMQRVQRVYGRIRDVEAALDDPLHLWARVSQAWDSAEHHRKPRMDAIVRHALELPRVFEALLHAPRKILRRRSDLQRLDRVQELDRASMLWAARQPGETLVERAGSTQRILAPVRVESFDTLENRVLRSLAELSVHVARSYCREVAAPETNRYRRVEHYRRLCRYVARDLRDRGVRLAPAGVAANYVLQNDVAYRRIWSAWQDLLRREQARDDLWRWQARSWEEFCGIALIVALERLPGSRLIAASPIHYRAEQEQGHWLVHDNPLAVFHLQHEGLVVEVQMHDRKEGLLGALAAPLWLRIADFGRDFQRRIAVWPLHSFGEGADPDDADDLLRLVEEVPRLQTAKGESLGGGLLSGAMVLRPSDLQVEAHRQGNGLAQVMSASIGVDGEALRRGLEILSDFCAGFLSRGAA